MTEHNEQYVRMTREPVAKLILSLSAPTILSMLVTSIYNIADTYFVSKIGTSASGAIGVVLAVMAMLQAVGFTIGMGGASQVSIFLGEEKQEQAILRQEFIASFRNNLKAQLDNIDVVNPDGSRQTNMR